MRNPKEEMVILAQSQLWITHYCPDVKISGALNSLLHPQSRADRNECSHAYHLAHLFTQFRTQTQGIVSISVKHNLLPH